MNKAMTGILAIVCTVLVIGCATEESSSDDDNTDTAIQDLSASFQSTCFGTSLKRVNNAIVHAQAMTCKKFDGTWGGFTQWNGTCFGDVSNCNGRIVCQSHCP